MSLTLRWVGTDELDRVAETRMRCYAHASKDITRYCEGIRADPRAAAQTATGDFLLAEANGTPVGTLTHLGMKMWVAGAQFDCQGIAYVGTVKTARRAAGAKGMGVASQLMHAGIARARERGDVVTALMPFRGSYYEHFGYGFVETRHVWTLPLSILPTGPTDGIRFYEPGDEQELMAFRNRVAQRGQCDIERSAAMWAHIHKKAEDGFEVIDRPPAPADQSSASPADPSLLAPVRGYLRFVHLQEHGQDVLHVFDAFYDDADALRRQLHFLASLKDQYSRVVLALPSDLPLPWLLKETQLPHRPVNHPTAKMEPATRLQLRVLDHRRLLESMQLPKREGGSVRITIAETGVPTTELNAEIAEGRVIVRPSGASAPEFTCTDRVWAAVVTGELPASRAVQYRLASCNDIRAATLLDIFAAAAPRPFCAEAF